MRGLRAVLLPADQPETDLGRIARVLQADEEMVNEYQGDGGVEGVRAGEEGDNEEHVRSHLLPPVWQTLLPPKSRATVG